MHQSRLSEGEYFLNVELHYLGGVFILSFNFNGPLDRINREQQERMRQLEQMSREMQNKRERQEHLNEKNSKHLENIEANTASLIDVVTLLRQNNEHQAEIKELIFEILSIAVLESEPERVSKYEQWRKKVADLGSAITGFKLLLSIGAAIFLGIPN
ncbi:hypothetical protein PTI45_03158 [Paenibacillus nuruki]|uniref:Uncharacterized protein n=1 Tax=Paenibacillus nuruki TaxID=1886670 RepID=A0A1E3L0Y0_9BACL|nr:hypothetical protein PTI45_03158 [Paenibacillus nuruki]